MRDKLLQLLIISVGILVIVKLFSLQVINSSSELIYNNASVQKIYEFPKEDIFMIEIINLLFQMISHMIFWLFLRMLI